MRNIPDCSNKRNRSLVTQRKNEVTYYQPSATPLPINSIPRRPPNLINERYLAMTPSQLENIRKQYDNMTHELLTGDIGELIELVKNRHPTCHIVLIHGCNCMNNMGAGLARRIKELWPEAAAVDQATKSHDINKLGTISGVTIDSDLSVINLHTQYGYGGNKVNVDYDAMQKCFDTIVQNSMVDYIHMIPKYIGCGLAGGDINIVTPMIEETFKNQAYYLFDI